MSENSKAAAAVEEERARQALRDLGKKATQTDVDRVKAAQKAYDKLK